MNERVLLLSQKRISITLPKLTMLLLSLLLFFLSTFRPGFSITAGNWSSEGVYSPWALLRTVNQAEALAGEILMENVSLKGCYKVSLKFTSSGYSKDSRSLTRALLEQAPGIARLCAVKVDGTFVGWLSDPSQLGEILNVILAENSSPTTISAGFNQKITAEYSYAPADALSDIGAVSAAIRNMCSVEVISINPGGSLPALG
ncbi:MAG TPA: hypothetical protein GXZ52_05655 [Clostridiales bacterium]|nr:hypothetical protein [Clostridiales bacterium]